MTILFSNIFPWANENNQKSLVPCISETLSIVLIYTATSEKRSQSRPDLTLPMATSHGPPLFPQPSTSAPAAIPAPSVASSYVPLKSPAQGSGRPSQEPRLRITPTPQTLLSPFEPFTSLNRSGHPSADPPIPAFIPLRPAFPTYQGAVTPFSATHMPTTHFDPSLRRSFTMPIPTHVPPRPYPSYTLPPITYTYPSQLGATQIHPDCQRDQDNSDYEEDGDDSDVSASNDVDGTLAKSPRLGRPIIGEDRPVRAQTLATPGLLAAGINDPSNSPPNGRANGFRAWIRQLVKRRRQPPNQTDASATAVQLPQRTTFICRLPGCQQSPAVESATRFGGFCGDSHMWLAMRDGVATQCRCKRWACPEGQAFCASCANV